MTKYIYKVLKQVHPDSGISSKAMAIMSDLNTEFSQQISKEAIRIAKANRTKTVTSREIQTAVRLLLPGELAKHAVSEGTKAVTRFTSSAGEKPKPKKKRSNSGTKAAKAPNPNPKTKARPVPKTSRAGLQFSVARCIRCIRKCGADRVGTTAGVYLAAALEYLCAEVLELAGQRLQSMKLKRVNPRAINLAIRGDEELNELVGKQGQLAGGGVMPNMHKAILPPKKSKK